MEYAVISGSLTTKPNLAVSSTEFCQAVFDERDIWIRLGGVSFSPNGKRLAIGGYSGIYVFTLPIEDVVALAKSRLTRTFSLEECQQYLHMDVCPPSP